MKFRLIATAAVAAVLVCNPAFASKKSFAQHVKMFDNKEAVLGNKNDALQARIDKRQAAGLDTSALQAKFANNNQHLTKLNNKEEVYKDAHPNASK